ncbi:MAG: hypothetical protein IKQ46_01245 [Bacteroidales bacterium]|nr:hypothetical protein [Bacteroidales bacterium]
MKIQHIILICFWIISCNTQQNNCTREYQDRIWLHRANDIEKAKYFQCKYEGLEIDVHFEDSLQTFVIKHDFGEQPKDERNPCILLEEWCNNLDRISELGIWFDFKNLDSLNQRAALECLKQIREKYNMSGKLIVESGNYKCLAGFQDAGFGISYYIPFYEENAMNCVTESNVILEIQKAILDGKIPRLSGYDYQYPFMRKNFPSMRKLLWTTSFDSERQKESLEILKADTLVEVLLLPNKQDEK